MYARIQSKSNGNIKSLSVVPMEEWAIQIHNIFFM